MPVAGPFGVLPMYPAICLCTAAGSAKRNMTSPIPPLNPLRTFEVAARLCSLTLAAEELNVSQVAVSRQVKTLVW